MYLLIYIYIVEDILFTSTVDELSAAGVAQVSPVVIPETDIHGEDIHSEYRLPTWWWKQKLSIPTRCMHQVHSIQPCA